MSFLTVGFQTVVNAAAGLIRMPWLRYTVAMLIGCAAWAAIYATVGIAAFEASLALAARSPWALVAVLAVAAGCGGRGRRDARAFPSAGEHGRDQRRTVASSWSDSARGTVTRGGGRWSRRWS